MTIDRRSLLIRAAGACLPFVGAACASTDQSAASRGGGPVRRARPSDASWPSAANWEQLGREVGGRLIAVRSPLATCAEAPESPACAEIFKRLKNPYYLGDEVGLTQTLGWVDGWTSRPSAYAVAARTTEDVVAAVNFARKHGVRLVVKGGGHSYLGTSNAPESLLIWTRAMDAITVHDGFVAAGCAGTVAPRPAVSVGAGAIWMRVYDEVTTKRGRYVQGGGCVTVGVAGLVQSGGFGSFSKRYGLAAAGLLEAEVVTADGAVRIANPCTNPDLFWALKATRHWSVALHVNKGLAGASPEDVAAARDTAMNPAVVDAFALAIAASEGPPAYPGIPGREPDLPAGRQRAAAVTRAMSEMRKLRPDPACYVSESDFFEAEWSRAYWGPNYPRLLAVKDAYDPGGLFIVHHGVGSERWSADGFTPLAASRP